MDAELISFGITGFLSGLAGAAINTFFSFRALRSRLNGSSTGNTFQNYLQQQFTAQQNSSGINETDRIKSDILALFDNFMAHQLTVKMPVLNMFMDDKLIAEIRLVFHDEMESQLPALMQKNLLHEKTISSISTLLQTAIKKYIIQSRSRIFIFIFYGGLAGSGIGLLAGIFLK